ncbi:MAG: NTP transferase domain-containing protein [Armatimonadetes bacterium]|nr:NTP transferase domain-containing protein [Armatimonadota bacterium]
MADAVAVVLAAGSATRFRTELPKPLHRVCGRALLEYALDAVTGAGIEGVAVVAPPDAGGIPALVGERARSLPGGASVSEGVNRALEALPETPVVLILPCDLPQLEARHLETLLERHRAGAAEATQLFVGGVATGVFAVERRSALHLPEDAPAEALFPAAACCELPGPALIDVDTRRDLAAAAKALRRAILDRLMDEGVTIVDPDHTYVDAGVRIGLDTILHPGTVIEGATVIGKRCAIGPQAHLVGATLEDEVTVVAAVVRESRLAARVRVGPFANIRSGCDVGAESSIGDFVELKNARLGARVSASHHAYLGDARIGEGVNIGAGVITCNYDGVRKHQTTIGAHAFIGSNSVLIAPVNIGAGAYVAAQSSINQDVPEDALGIARARQENKPGWARQRRRAQGKD